MSAQRKDSAPKPAFQITRDLTWVQSREDLNFPRLNNFGDDRYALRFTRGRHGGGEWIHWLISEDRGQTWMDDRNANWPEIEGYHGTDYLQRRDGSLLGIIQDIKTSSWFGQFWGEITSHDHGRTWAHSLKPAFGPDSRHGSWRFIPWNPPIELPDGTLIAVGYGPLGVGDPDSEVFVFHRAPDETIWRRSENSVFGPQPKTMEGTNEACLARMGSGAIACVSRTGYPDSPMLWATSKDDGRTWSAPCQLPWSAVDPKLYVMEDKTLLLIFGAREADLLHGAMTAVYSHDEGETWSPPFVFYDGPGSSYHTGIKTGPNALLVSYSAGRFRRRELPQFTAPGEYNRICAAELQLG